MLLWMAATKYSPLVLPTWFPTVVLDESDGTYLHGSNGSCCSPCGMNECKEAAISRLSFLIQHHIHEQRTSRSKGREVTL